MGCGITYRLSLTAIDDLKDPRLEKYLIIQNGKQVIDMNIGLSFSEEIGAISKEQQAIKNNLQKRKYCYVATIIYKDINAPEVIKLRNWRDNVLCNNVFGKLIIKIYYSTGKYLAICINKSLVLKVIIKYFLDKFINKLNIR
ncbi:MAG: hypothetical protein M1326_02495 [Cyanobacteria bacterium]|nr:hypothetical protein [Cyanobacteriota bacterium]